MADHITDEAVTAAGRAFFIDTLDPGEWDDLTPATQERARNRMRAALAAALPVLDTTKDETAVLEVIDERDDAEKWADRLAYAIAGIAEIGEHSSTNNPWERALAEAAELHATNERMRQRLFELGPIIDALAHGGVADELTRLRRQAATLREEYAGFFHPAWPDPLHFQYGDDPRANAARWYAEHVGQQPQIEVRRRVLSDWVTVDAASLRGEQ